jgi:hypothetical protein
LNKSALKENKSAMIKCFERNKSAMKNIIQVPEKNILQHDHDICKLSRLGYPSMHFCSLATTVYCTRQSAFLLNQSQNENENQNF